MFQLSLIMMTVMALRPGLGAVGAQEPPPPTVASEAPAPSANTQGLCYPFSATLNQGYVHTNTGRGLYLRNEQNERLGGSVPYGALIKVMECKITTDEEGKPKAILSICRLKDLGADCTVPLGWVNKGYVRHVPKAYEPPPPSDKQCAGKFQIGDRVSIEAEKGLRFRNSAGLNGKLAFLSQNGAQLKIKDCDIQNGKTYYQAAEFNEDTGLISETSGWAELDPYAEVVIDDEADEIEAQTCEGGACEPTGASSPQEPLMNLQLSSPLPFEPDQRKRCVSSAMAWRYHPIRRYCHFHPGADIRASHGTPALAMQDGVVIQVGTAAGCGQFVTIHYQSLGVVSRFCHLKRGSLKVKEGTKVNAGQQVAQIDRTGSTTAPHLHLELAQFSEGVKSSMGQQINPQKLFDLPCCPGGKAKCQSEPRCEKMAKTKRK